MHGLLLMCVAVAAQSSQTSEEGFGLPVLRSADGPLSVSSLEIEVHIEGRLATTELRQTFHSNAPVESEGTYTLRLPAGASLSRLAMDIEGELVEGELLERERARSVYEEIVRGQKDPALVEWQGQDRFQMQVFPIPANGDKRVIVAWEQLLPSTAAGVTYVLPLPHTGTIDRFSLTADVAGASSLRVSGAAAHVREVADGARASVSGERYALSGPLRIEIPRPAESSTRVGVAQDLSLFLADVTFGARAVKGVERDVVIALDTSASVGDVELARAIDAARAIVGGLPRGARSRLVHGDVVAAECRWTFERCVKDLDAGGASDLGALLRTAASAARSLGGPSAIVVIGDGVASLGELDQDLLQSELVESLRGADVTMHAVMTGAAPAEDSLRALTRSLRGHVVRMTPASSTAASAEELLRLIRVPLVTAVTVRVVEGSVDNLMPQRAVDVPRGEALAVMGVMRSRRVVLEAVGTYGGRTLTERVRIVRGDAVEDPLLGRAFARARIDELEHATDVDRAELIKTSVSWGVMSRYTSFLVLENDEAYRRYSIDRVRQRAHDDEDETARHENLRKSEESLQSMLALESTKTLRSESSYGMSVGAMGRKVDRPVSIVMGSPMILGSLDKEIIRRVVREHTAQIRYCYERELQRQPLLNGRVGMRWVINGQGLVMQVATATTQLGNGPVERCIESKIRAWVFPKVPGGGVVVVSYPFVFTRAGVEGTPGPTVDLAPVPPPPPPESMLDPKATAQRVRSHVDSDMPAARALLTRALARFDVDGDIELTTEIADLFPDEYTAALLAALKVRADDEELADRLVDHLSGGSAMARVLAGVTLRGPALYVAYEGAKNTLSPAALAELLDTWITRGVDDDFLVALELVDRHPRLTHAAAKRMIEGGDTDAGVFMALAHSAALIGEVKPAAELLLARCSDGACDGALKHLAADPRVARAIDERFGPKLKEIVERRSEDMANAEDVIAHAALLESMARAREAQRVLSELVEFVPHDHEARARYAEQLSARGMHRDACKQLALGVQLSPAERDTFLAMMTIRRDHPSEAAAVRSCIVDGVSKLPVQRALSVVLTWENAESDVDLHVVDPSGEEVWYQSRESSRGGFLYHDVTDGFGPEIYVLGSKHKGTYRFSLVHYRGEERVRGTVTVIRHAGSPEETREDHPFELGPADERSVPIFSLKL